MTPQEILSNNITLDNFIVALAHAKITNVDGSAFRRHPQMYWERGVLITSHWSTFNYCDIKIATVPTTKLIPGDNNPRYEGNPYPHTEEGELVCVWDGKWLKEGPWVQVVYEVIDGLISRLESHRSQLRAKREAEEKERELATKRLDDKLLAGWIGAECK